MNDERGRQVEVAEVLGDLRGFEHGAADDGDFAAVLAGELAGDADAVDGGGEAAEEELLLRAGEDFVEAGFDGPLAGRVAGAIDVGGVLEKGEDAALAVFGEAVEVEGFAVGRGEVDFEVAGVDDDADGGFDGEGDAVDEGVGDADGLDGEGAEGELFAGDDFDELGIFESVLFELAVDVGEGELGAVDGDVELGEDPGQSADVVFVAVGEDDGADVLLVLDEVGDVGDDDVDAEELGLGEHEAGIDDDDVVFVAEGEAVHAELAESA